MSHVDLIWSALYLTLTVVSVVAIVAATGYVVAILPTFYGCTTAMDMLRGSRSTSREEWEQEAPKAMWKQCWLYGVPLTLLFWPAILPALLGRWQLVISVLWLIVTGIHLGRYFDNWFYG